MMVVVMVVVVEVIVATVVAVQCRSRSWRFELGTSVQYYTATWGHLSVIGSSAASEFCVEAMARFMIKGDGQ